MTITECICTEGRVDFIMWTTSPIPKHFKRVQGGQIKGDPALSTQGQAGIERDAICTQVKCAGMLTGDTFPVTMQYWMSGEKLLDQQSWCLEYRSRSYTPTLQCLQRDWSFFLSHIIGQSQVSIPGRVGGSGSRSDRELGGFDFVALLPVRSCSHAHDRWWLAGTRPCVSSQKQDMRMERATNLFFKDMPQKLYVSCILTARCKGVRKF